MYEEEIDEETGYAVGCESCEWTQAKIAELSEKINALERTLFAESKDLMADKGLRKLRSHRQAYVQEQMYHQRERHGGGEASDC